MQMSNKDLGSSFYELKPNDPAYKILTQYPVKSNTTFTAYYSGRNAFMAVFKDIANKTTINKIWLPSYYCDTVINLINRNFNNVHYYNIDPFHFNNDLDITEFAKDNDVVVINNFWGLSSFKNYSCHTNKPIIIEDHTHGWLSEKCLNSKADYCISSLRKTYPIPLGAVAWKPNSKDVLLPYKDTNDLSIIDAHNALLTSMQLKRQHLKRLKDPKKKYLTLLKNGESLLDLSNSYIKPEDVLIKQIQHYYNYDPNPIKNRNFKLTINSLETSKNFKVINREGFTPFGLLLLFKDEKIFNSLKSWLISNQIYPAHLWPNTSTNIIWRYLLNLHIDFRYNKEDISYLVEKINIWIKNNV